VHNIAQSKFLLHGYGLLHYTMPTFKEHSGSDSGPKLRFWEILNSDSTPLLKMTNDVTISEL